MGIKDRKIARGGGGGGGGGRVRERERERCISLKTYFQIKRINPLVRILAGVPFGIATLFAVRYSSRVFICVCVYFFFRVT